ncbi:MAG: hypothetical protein JRJ59_09545 [Deltaproteobacteria bacterium]|nr:hypothetical protein [Deltaproteobacteria bacterium]
MPEFAIQCQVCAWRADCKKKFTIQAQDGRVRCPDFSRDLNLPQEPAPEPKEERLNESQT